MRQNMRSLALQYIKPVYIPVLPLGKSKVQYTMTTFHAIQSNIKPRATQLLFSSLFTWLGFKENSKYTFKRSINSTAWIVYTPYNTGLVK